MGLLYTGINFRKPRVRPRGAKKRREAMARKLSQVRYDGQWESGWCCWTDLVTGSTFSTKTKRTKEVLEAARAVRENFENEECSYVRH